MNNKILSVKNEPISIISVQMLKKGTIRTKIKVREILFTRLEKEGYPINWYENLGLINGCQALTIPQEIEIESIFQAYLEKLKKNQKN